MLVSVTEIMNYIRCGRLWDYTSYNRQSLTGVVSKPHFTIGSCIHGGLADWLMHPEGDLVDFYANHATLAVSNAVKHYTALVGAGPSPVELVDLYTVLQLGKVMMQNYQDYYKTPIDKRYHIVQAEQTITIPIPDSHETCRICGGNGCLDCQNVGWVQNYVEGTLDGIIADSRDRLLVLEHKTYNSKPRRDSLDMNFQFIAYQWALTKLGIGPVIGLAYDGMWKRDGTGKNQGPSELFFRDIITASKAELSEFEEYLTVIVNEMSNNPSLYPRVPWHGCWDCGFINLCKAQSSNKGYHDMLTSRYIKREKTMAFEDDD